MDYEKLHKDTINKLQQMVSCGEITVETACGICADFVPESEDEKIRKAILKWLSNFNAYDKIFDSFEYEKINIIEWLEKQGEQKSEVKYVYIKFRIGDVIVEIKPNGYCPPVRVKHIGIGAYSCESDDGKRSLSFPITNQDEYKLVEQKPTKDDVEPKFKVGDVIRLKGSAAEYTIKRVTDTTYYTDGWSCSIERCEEDYELVEKKPSAWSDEDEYHKRQILRILKDNGCSQTLQEKTEKWIEERLKSLRPQKWKPSDEQVKALGVATNISNIPEKEYQELEKLYQDLKKLKGE